MWLGLRLGEGTAILRTGGCVTRPLFNGNKFCDISGLGGGMLSAECHSSPV